MPPDVRTAMRNAWYQGSDAQLKITNTYEIVNVDLPVQIPYRTTDPKAEFVALVMEHLNAAAGPARSQGEFQAWFRTDADCLDYLECAG